MCHVVCQDVLLDPWEPRHYAIRCYILMSGGFILELWGTHICAEIVNRSFSSLSTCSECVHIFIITPAIQACRIFSMVVPVYTYLAVENTVL